MMDVGGDTCRDVIVYDAQLRVYTELWNNFYDGASSC